MVFKEHGKSSAHGQALCQWGGAASICKQQYSLPHPVLHIPPVPISLSYPKHFPVLWHFPVFPFTYIQNENATWQTPIHPSRPSSNKFPLMLYINLGYPSLKWLLSSLALTIMDIYLKQGMFIMCCKCFLTFLTPDAGTVSYSFLYHLCLMQCLAHGRIECAQ